jgi:unspecific monooxygenase
MKRTLVGSHGVPGTALAWVIREMGTRPDVLAGIRSEAGRYPDAVEAGSPAPLPYTEAVVKEVLRLFPPVWLMLREVRERTTLGPWRLEPRQHVLLPAYLVHRDARWWREPDRFRPGRWLTAGTGGAPHARHAYFPFGGGPRMCLGSRLGMLQLVLAAQRLAGAYDVELVGAEHAPPVFDATLAPVGLRARLTARGA